MLRKLSQNVVPASLRVKNSYVCSSCLSPTSGSFIILLKRQIRHESTASFATLKSVQDLTPSTENATIVEASGPQDASPSFKSENEEVITSKARSRRSHRKKLQRNVAKTSIPESPLAALQGAPAADTTPPPEKAKQLGKKGRVKANKVKKTEASSSIEEPVGEPSQEPEHSINKYPKKATRNAKGSTNNGAVKPAKKAKGNVAILKDKSQTTPSQPKTKRKAKTTTKSEDSSSPLLAFVSKHGSDVAAMKFEEYLDGQSETEKKAQIDRNARKQLIALLQSDKLSPKSREVAMRHLRDSLVSKLNSKASNTSLEGQLKAYTSIKDALRESPNVASPRASKTRGNHEIPDLSSKNIFKRQGDAKEAIDIQSVNAEDLELVPVIKDQPDVPCLSYGLERVLFNPGVYQLRDPRSRVFNFDPYLQTIMPVSEFDFNALKEYVTSSRDDTLLSTAKAENRKYTGSTSSMTSALAHFHFLLSWWRPVNVGSLSKSFPADLLTFTALQRSPSAVFLRWKDGTYAIDADKQFDTANILSMLGKSMEKLLTLPTEDFERYRKINSDQISDEERNEAEAFHYTTMGDFLMRSQLDAYDPRIPGTGMFDLKTRAVVSIRMDTQNYEEGMGYEIRGRHGEFESYEREYFDMIRAAFLKYSLQVRMGRMDGIFVAFHNTERIFGFQYISLPEMDAALHGTEDTTLGDQEFKLSLDLLNRVLDRATKKYPEQSIRLHFETRSAKTPFMYIFAEPVTEDEIKEIQEAQKAKVEAFEKKVLGLHIEPTAEELAEKQRQTAEEELKQKRAAEWEALQASVKETMEIDAFKSPIEDNGESAGVLSTITDAGNENDSSAGRASLDDEADNVQEEEEVDEDSDDVDSEEEEGEEEEDEIEETSDEQDRDDIDEVSEEEQTAFDVDNDQQIGASDSDAFVPLEKEVLAMTLTLRNKVNGEFVLRPVNLTPADKWTVEYSLAEVHEPLRARSLYNATQERRRQALDRDTDTDADPETINPYLQRLRELSSKGREWRMQQDALDEEESPKVLKTAPIKYAGDEEPKEE